MKFLRSSITILCVSASLVMAALGTSRAQEASGAQTPVTADTPAKSDAAALQKKATQAQAGISANRDDHDQLIRAIKVNEVGLAKQVLLRNGFTPEDLENTKIILRTGGGKGAENEIEISASCCDPKEIIIQRCLPYFTK